ncbi:hypothetical protein ABT255_20490 [Streptomyces mirabilis]|uniref:hypothetical protein n=1 Tax=Streptomyces mirabilis TaxID=68239 RepID=UPI003333CAC3
MEYESVRLVLRSLTEQSDARRNIQELQRFLNKGIDLLSNPRNHGLDQDPILAAAYGAEEVANKDERGTVLRLLSEKRIIELRRIEEVTQATDTSPTTYIVNGKEVTFISGGVKMSDYRFSVGGDFKGVVGENNVVRDSFQVIESSDASVELKDLLKQLTQATALAANQMPEDQADQCLRDFDTFRNEALSSKPRKSMLEAIGGALTKTASFLGDVGAPVANLVIKVIELIP